MMPFLDVYDKMTHLVGLRYRDWNEAVETTEAAEPIQPRAMSAHLLQKLAAWATSRIEPAPVPRARRRHA